MKQSRGESDSITYLLLTYMSVLAQYYFSYQLFPGHGIIRGKVTLLPSYGIPYYRVRYEDKDEEDIHIRLISKYVVTEFRSRYPIGQMVKKVSIYIL